MKIRNNMPRLHSLAGVLLQPGVETEVEADAFEACAGNESLKALIAEGSLEVLDEDGVPAKPKGKPGRKPKGSTPAISPALMAAATEADDTDAQPE